MDDMIQVVCRGCRTPFVADGSLRGQTVYCPTCNSAVRIEEAWSPEPALSPTFTGAALQPGVASTTGSPVCGKGASERSESPRLRLLKDHIASGRGRMCPRCGAPMAEDHIVCGTCGWNTRTNRSMADAAQRADVLRELVSTLIKVMIVIAVGWIAWAAVVRDWLRTRPREAEVVTPPSGAAEGSIVSNGAAAVRAAASAEMEAAAREEVIHRMNERFPRIADGEMTVVAMRNGRILRGHFERRPEGSGFTITMEGGVVEQHPFEHLQAASRLRCDDAYRAREIEREVDRKLGR